MGHGSSRTEDSDSLNSDTSEGKEAAKSKRKGRARRSSGKGKGSLTLGTSEIRLVRKSWAHARRLGASEPGAAVLTTVLTKSTEIRRIFSHVLTASSPRPSKGNYPELGAPAGETSTRRLSPSPKVSLTTECVLGSELFLKHAERFTHVLDLLVANLENPSQVRERLRDLGADHAQRIKHFCFETRYWDVFGQVLVEKSLTWGTTVGYQHNPILLNAWCQIFLFLITQIKDGYENQRRHRLRERLGTVRRRFSRRNDRTTRISTVSM